MPSSPRPHVIICPLTVKTNTPEVHTQDYETHIVIFFTNLRNFNILDNGKLYVTKAGFSSSLGGLDEVILPQVLALVKSLLWG
jgi:hypothetical protein